MGLAQILAGAGRAVAAFCLLLGAAVPARAAPAAVAIAVGEPPGFAALTGPQKALVDIYFGGRRMGEASIVYEPGSLRFERPDAVVALLPGLADQAAVTMALANPSLPSNARLVCSPGSDPARCGRLGPEIAGVIFNEARFRVDVFVNPLLLRTQTDARERFLPRPQGGLSLVNAVTAVMSGSSTAGRIFSVQNRTIAGDADRRLRADIAWSSGLGLQADELVAEVDRPGWRFSAGAFWAPGSDLIGRRRILGIGAETQFDTRIDKDEMRGSPLVVFLDQRAKVDIVRDGRVIATRIYEAGNRVLDTSGLPDGAYDVTLRIEETGGAVREERRFFSRNRQIAPVGSDIYFAYAGVLVDDASKRFLAPTRTPFLQIGAATRLSPKLALDATVLATDRAIVAQAGASWISPVLQVRAAGIVSSNGVRGGVVRVGSSGNSRFNFDFDLRRIAMRETTGPPLPSRPPGDTPFGPIDSFGIDRAALPVARKSFTQLAGSLSYSLLQGQFGVAATYRRERGERATYNAGPWIRWNLLRRGPWQLMANADFSVTNEGKSGFAGLSLRFVGTRAAFGGNAGWRARSGSGAGRRSGAVASLDASLQGGSQLGTEWDLGAGIDHDLDRDMVNARATLRARPVQFSGDISHALGRGGATQYSLGVQSTLALRSGNVSFVGRNRNDAMVLVRVESTENSSKFDVLVDESLTGTLTGSGSVAIPLTPYRQYDVRIRPRDGAPLHYDGAARQIAVYPGNIARLDWAMKRLVVMFGRLAFADGRPVAMAAIKAEGGIGQSDDNGYFQLEAAAGAPFAVTLGDGRTCRVQPPSVATQEAYARLGTLVCNPGFRNGPINTASRE